MDAILFYGENSRSDASRRQVRSAAAQHSHRIGPRKPKTSKKPKPQPNNTPHQKKRSFKTDNFNNVSPGTALGQTNKPTAAPVVPCPLTQVRSVQPSFNATALPPFTAHPSNAAAPPSSLPSPAGITPINGADQEKEFKRQAAQARFREIQAIQWQQQILAEQDNRQEQEQQQQQQQQQQQHYPHHDSHQYLVDSLAPGLAALPTLPPLQLPDAPPSVVERIGQAQQQEDRRISTRSTASSQASPQSPSTRLPQYSWTEYPRYGLGSNHLPSSLQMLAQVAVAERETSEARLPTHAAAHEVSGFRQSRTNDQQPYPLPALAMPSGSPASVRDHELPFPTGPVPSGSQLAAGHRVLGAAGQPLTDPPPPSHATSTLRQFSENAINGHKRVDEVQRRSSDSTSREEREEKLPGLLR